MLTVSVSHDHMITQNVNKDLLILKCACHLKTLKLSTYRWLQLSVNICKLYRNIYDHRPYCTKAIQSLAI